MKVFLATILCSLAAIIPAIGSTVGGVMADSTTKRVVAPSGFWPAQTNDPAFRAAVQTIAGSGTNGGVTFPGVVASTGHVVIYDPVGLGLYGSGLIYGPATHFYSPEGFSGDATWLYNLDIRNAIDGTLSASHWQNENGHLLLLGPNSSTPGKPTFRLLSAGDIPAGILNFTNMDAVTLAMFSGTNGSTNIFNPNTTNLALYTATNHGVFTLDDDAGNIVQLSAGGGFVASNATVVANRFKGTVSVTNLEGVVAKANLPRQGVPVYNVEDFGAYHDGTHDDSPAFQAALDACTNSPGGRVFAPGGFASYFFTNTFTPRAGQAIASFGNETNSFEVFGDGFMTFLEGSTNGIIKIDASPAALAYGGFYLHDLKMGQPDALYTSNWPAMFQIVSSGTNVVSDNTVMNRMTIERVTASGGAGFLSISNATTVYVSVIGPAFYNYYSREGFYLMRADTFDMTACGGASLKTDTNQANSMFFVKSVWGGNTSIRPDAGVGMRFNNIEVNGNFGYFDACNVQITGLNIEDSAPGASKTAIVVTNSCYITAVGVVQGWATTTRSNDCLFDCWSSGGRYVKLINPVWGGLNPAVNGYHNGGANQGPRMFRVHHDPARSMDEEMPRWEGQMSTIEFQSSTVRNVEYIVGGVTNYILMPPGQQRIISLTDGTADNIVLSQFGTGTSGMTMLSSNIVYLKMGIARLNSDWFTDAQYGDTFFRSEAKSIRFGAYPGNGNNSTLSLDRYGVTVNGGLSLPQLDWIPTNSIPSSSSGVTNWVICNLTNSVGGGGITLVATNTAAAGSFLLLRPTVTASTWP